MNLAALRSRFSPHTLFGRTALVIALVSLAFQIFTLTVITYFALLPLGRHATEDFAALMLLSAQSWQSAPTDQRVALKDYFERQYRFTVRVPQGDITAFPRFLPYFHFLEAVLSAKSGQPITLKRGDGPDGTTWYWIELSPGGDASQLVQVGFPANRVAVQPSAALLIILFVGSAVTFLTSAWLANWLIKPLARLAAATQRIGKGQRPAPLPETGPTELATLAREFNRMGIEVEELLANRTTLLAGISHDLRSPLARLRLGLGMLAEKPDADLLERALHDVENMNTLIARCLEVGRDFAEKDSVELNLCDLLANIVQEHAASGAVIRGQKGHDCRLRVRPLALKRILSNLVDNAVCQGDGQPIDIEYQLEGGTVEIRVLDRGAGIPESEREAVFRPFHRLDRSRSSHTGGSGLGLAIVRQIATANGWSVTLEERPGGGTIARVRLPLENHPE